MIDLTPYIESYLRDWPRINGLEFYKWIAFKHYRENSTKKFCSIHERISSIYGKSGNLLAAKKYFPLGVLLDMASNKGKPDRIFAPLYGKNLHHITGRIPRHSQGRGG